MINPETKETQETSDKLASAISSEVIIELDTVTP